MRPIAIKPSSSLARSSYISVPTKRGRFVVDSREAQQFTHMNCVSTQVFNGVQSNLLSARNKYTGIITAGSFGLLKSALVAINITISSAAARLVGTPYWFENIEIKSDKGSRSVTTIYNDSLYTALGVYPREQLKGLLKLMNFQTDFHPQDSYPSGYTNTFYLPIDVSVLNELYMKNIPQDLQIVFNPIGDIRASGSGTITVNSMSILFRTDELDPKDSKLYSDFYSSYSLKNSFLEPLYNCYQARTLTAGTRTDIELSNLQGLASHLQVIIKAAGASNTNFGSQRFISLGEGGTLDLLSPSQQSLFGKGVAVPEGVLRSYIYATTHESGMDSASNFYELNFSDSTRDSALGKVSGVLDFNSQKFFLSVTPAGAGTAEVQTITTNNTPDAGRYAIEFQGYRTDYLAFGANAATVKAAIEALPPLADALGGAVTVTVSGDITTSPTLTFSTNFNNPDGDLFYVVSNMEDGGVPSTCNSAMTTRGRIGFVTGSYDIYVYSYNHMELVQGSDGSIAKVDSREIIHQL